MTVSYTAEVATCRGFGCFWQLLFRWRGSIYKLLWPELIVYIVCYYSLSLIYRLVLDDENKRYFEKIARYCNTYADLIPVTFILGFYISMVLKRWWDQFVSIPWPDALALFVSASIHGQDERGRLMRRTIMRYVNLSLVMTLRCISPRVKKRFPTLDHLQEAGILLRNEKKIIEDLNKKTPQYPKHWMPLVWASSVVTRARKEKRILDDFAVKTLIDELSTFRGQCGGLFIYDWISIPLVYTQVVTLAVYTFFFATVMGRQYLDPAQGYRYHEIDLYIPVFTFLQFFFYMGWLKVAETLVNPFGEDDDDFEMNWLIDRNIQVSYLIVDEIHQEHPELIKDQYWDEVMPQELPYTAASEQYRRDPPKGSAADISIPDDQAEFVPMETVYEEQDDDEVNSSTVRSRTNSTVSQDLINNPFATKGGKFEENFEGTVILEIDKQESQPRSVTHQPSWTQRIVGKLFQVGSKTMKDNIHISQSQPNILTTIKRATDQSETARLKHHQTTSNINISDPKLFKLFYVALKKPTNVNNIEKIADDLVVPSKTYQKFAPDQYGFSVCSHHENQIVSNKSKIMSEGRRNSVMSELEAINETQETTSGKSSQNF